METGSPINRSSDLEGDSVEGRSTTPAENPKASTDTDVHLDPTVLASVADEIRHAYELAPDRTGLVLYDVDPDHLQVQWKVTLDDLDRARRAFPGHSSGLILRLLLRRLNADGGRSDVAAIERKAGGGALQGQVVLGVEGGDADYQAELGLANAEGGWLLLARSNQVRPPRSATERARPQDEMPEIDESEVEPALAAEGVPLEPVFPMPGLDRPDSALPGSIGSTPVASTEAVSGAAVGERQVDLRAAASWDQGGGADGAWAELAPPLMPSSRVDGNGDSTVAADLYDPRAALSSRELWRFTPGHRDLELHAELVIWGQATPGDRIDILGTLLRAEPDGRFSLRLPVEDYESLARALSVKVEPPTGHDGE